MAFSINRKIETVIGPILTKIQLLRGEAIWLKGANGSGKSTVFKYLKSTFKAGAFCEQEIIGAMPYYLVEDVLNILKDVSEKKKGKEFDDKLFLNLLNQLNIEYILNKKIEYLSGGEGQCLKLIINLSFKKDFYFFDEPFTFLDEDKRAFFLNQFCELKKMKAGIFIIDHLPFYDDFFDREYSLVINDGNREITLND